MRLQRVRVRGYRSVRDVDFELGSVNVLTGANGTGKSNLYRALHLLQHAALGAFGRAIGDEGGMTSVLWAGPERFTSRKAPPRRVQIELQGEEYGFSFAVGMPQKPPPMSPTMFELDPEVKEEAVWHGPHRRPSATVLERKGGHVRARDAHGETRSYPWLLAPSESALSQLQEPAEFPELTRVGQWLRGFRFYHHFRTDAESPIRQPQVSVRTEVLAADGRDLVAALQTIREGMQAGELRDAIATAFRGGAIDVSREGNRFSLWLKLPEIQRSFDTREMSDGTLRYLCLVAALLSPRPPQLLAFNEPEMSLHPALLEPLAVLFAKAAATSQLWIVTHSQELAAGIRSRTGQAPIELEMVDGETKIRGRGILGLVPDDDG